MRHWRCGLGPSTTGPKSTALLRLLKGEAGEAEETRLEGLKPGRRITDVLVLRRSWAQAGRAARPTLFSWFLQGALNRRRELKGRLELKIYCPEVLGDNAWVWNDAAGVYFRVEKGVPCSLDENFSHHKFKKEPKEPDILLV